MRTVQLWAGSGSGTAFTIEVDGRQYLVTAKHVVGNESEFLVTKDGSRKRLGFRDVWRSPDADVAVIAPDVLVAPPMAVDTSREGMYFSQDAYFLGFPFGIAWTPKGDVNNGYPLALARRAIVSDEFRDPSGRDLLLLDAHANEGFPGGPVFVYPTQKKPNIIGVLIGYHAQLVKVHGLSDAVATVQANTGLALAEPIDIAIDGARALGSGKELPED